MFFGKNLKKNEFIPKSLLDQTIEKGNDEKSTIKTHLCVSFFIHVL